MFLKTTSLLFLSSTRNSVGGIFIHAQDRSKAGGDLYFSTHITATGGCNQLTAQQWRV